MIQIVAKQLITKRYADLLKKEFDSLGISRDDLPMGRSTAWRVLEARGSVSVSKAEDVRRYILEKSPNAKIPPPVVAVESVEHYELMELGGLLAREDPSYLAQVVRAMKERVVGRAMVDNASKALGLPADDDDGSDPSSD